MSPVPLHLAVALDGAGWHPAAWRAADARPGELFSADYWVDLVQEAERGRLDFVTIDDSLAIQSSRRGIPDDRTDQVRGRLDAVLSPPGWRRSHRSIGLIPVATTTHTEPFHVSKAIATLDYVSTGRAGLQARISSTSLEAGQFGRRTIVDRSDAERRSRGRAGRRGRPFRRGRRLRRGRPAPLGQLGGRRRDPRRGDRPLRRPRQAALHRLRGTVVLGEGPVDHAPPSAGPAARDRPGPRPGRLPPGGPQRRRRLRHARGRARTRPTSSPASGPHEAAVGRDGDRRCGSSPTWWSSSTSDAGAAASPQGPARRARRPRAAVRCARVRRHRRPSWPTCWWPGRPTGIDGFRLRPGRAAPRPRGDHPPGRRRCSRSGGSSAADYDETTLRERLGLPRPANRYADA